MPYLRRLRVIVGFDATVGGTSQISKINLGMGGSSLEMGGSNQGPWLESSSLDLLSEPDKFLCSVCSVFARYEGSFELHVQDH